MIKDAFIMDLLKLPSHLQLTLRTLASIGVATAAEVAVKTNRARAVESAYLNQLVLLEMVKKTKDGRKKIFVISGGNLDGANL